jgi:hypothetical protein
MCFRWGLGLVQFGLVSSERLIQSDSIAKQDFQTLEEAVNIVEQ